MDSTEVDRHLHSPTSAVKIPQPIETTHQSPLVSIVTIGNKNTYSKIGAAADLLLIFQSVYF